MLDEIDAIDLQALQDSSISLAASFLNDRRFSSLEHFVAVAIAQCPMRISHPTVVIPTVIHKVMRSIAVRTIRIPNCSSTCFKPMCQPPNPSKRKLLYRRVLGRYSISEFDVLPGIFSLYLKNLCNLQGSGASGSNKCQLQGSRSTTFTMRNISPSMAFNGHQQRRARPYR